MLEFNYETARRSDSVVVLAAGTSLLKNVAATQKYIQENKSIVIATNYNYPIASDYTFYGDPDRFDNSMRTIKTKEILVAYDLKGRFKKRFGKKLWLKLINNKQLYFWGRNMNKKKWRFRPKQKLETNEDGGLQFRPGTSAFAAMIVASTCRPKRILIVGLDGPFTNPEDKSKLLKYNFDGKKRNYRSQKHYKMKRMMIKHKVMRFLGDRGIKVDCFSNCPFWGLDKEEMGINTIHHA